MTQTAEEYKTLRQRLADRDGCFCHYCGRGLITADEAGARIAELQRPESPHGNYLDPNLTDQVRAIYTAAHDEYNLRVAEYEKQVSAINDQKIVIEHKVPKVRGGRASFANLVPACRKCNGTKGTMNYYVACMKLRPAPYTQTVMFPPGPDVLYARVVRSMHPRTSIWTDWYCYRCESTTCLHADGVTQDAPGVLNAYIDWAIHNAWQVGDLVHHAIYGEGIITRTTWIFEVAFASGIREVPQPELQRIPTE